MAASPPPFVLEASELLRLPPEVIRLAKRDEAMDPESLALLRDRFSRLTSPSPQLTARDMLLAITSRLILRGGWSEGALLRYLDSLQQLSPCFAVGLSPALAPAAVYHQRFTRQPTSCSIAEPPSTPNKSPAHADLDRLNAIAAKSHGVLLKFQRLRQLESARASLLRRILEDEFVRKCGVSKIESVLFLLAAKPGEESSSSIQRTCLQLMQAQSALNESQDNEAKFLSWLRPDARVASGSSDAVEAELLQALPCLIELQEVVRRILSKPSSATVFSSNIDGFCDKLLELLDAHRLPVAPPPLSRERGVASLLLQELLSSHMQRDGAMETAVEEQRERCSRTMDEAAQSISVASPFRLITK